MVEVLEYALVVLASSMLVFFSVEAYSGFTSALGPATDEATFASVLSLANAAVEHGSASATLYISNATIGCDSGTLTFASGRYSQNSSLPVDCSFAPQGVSGERHLAFSYSGSLLTLEVQ